jgi:hypothetical protein
MITPAHGQAVSIAAGTYSFTYFIYEAGECEIIGTRSINWPGGVGPHLVNLTFDPSSVIELGPCTSTDRENDTDLYESPTLNVKIVTDPSEGIELGASNPPLPSGLFFVATPI